MSSDESDHDAGKGEATYVIRRKSWRSKALTELLRTLDAFHLRERYNRASQASSGAWPHFRISGEEASMRAAVKGLSKNCYHATWLQDRSPFQLAELAVVKTACDLTMPAHVMKYAFI